MANLRDMANIIEIMVRILKVFLRVKCLGYFKNGLRHGYGQWKRGFIRFFLLFRAWKHG